MNLKIDHLSLSKLTICPSDERKDDAAAPAVVETSKVPSTIEEMTRDQINRAFRAGTHVTPLLTKRDVHTLQRRWPNSPLSGISGCPEIIKVS